MNKEKRQAELYRMAKDLIEALDTGSLVPDDIEPETRERLQRVLKPRRKPIHHDLKCWEAPFEAILDGRKRFEIRKADRDFEVDDVLTLREWDPIAEIYKARCIDVRVTYIVHGGVWGLPDTICVMGIEVLTRAAA